jgi:uncharacterized membrane-anchored protein
LYFVLSVVAFVGNTAYYAFAHFGSVSASSLFGTVLSVVGFFPLYGYVRQRRYDPRWLWKVVFAFSCVGTIAVVLICTFVAVANFAITPILAVAALLLLGGPYVLALHQYIYRSPHLWA